MPGRLDRRLPRARARPRRARCSPACGPTTTASRACSRPYAGGLCLYVDGGRRRRRHRARPLVRHARRDRRGPGHRLGRRPALRLPRAAHRHAAADGRARASRWAAPSRLVGPARGRPRARRRRRRRRRSTAASSWTPDRTGPAAASPAAAAGRSRRSGRRLPRNGGSRQARLALPTRRFAGPGGAGSTPAPVRPRRPGILRPAARTGGRSRMEARGIEPLTPACKAGVFPLAPRPRVRHEA